MLDRRAAEDLVGQRRRPDEQPVDAGSSPVPRATRTCRGDRVAARRPRPRAAHGRARPLRAAPRWHRQVGTHDHDPHAERLLEGRGSAAGHVQAVSAHEREVVADQDVRADGSAAPTAARVRRRRASRNLRSALSASRRKTAGCRSRVSPFARSATNGSCAQTLNRRCPGRAPRARHAPGTPTRAAHPGRPARRARTAPSAASPPGGARTGPRRPLGTSAAAPRAPGSSRGGG